jgi:methionine sulfoxide reductase heme-binding subunit
MVKAVVFVLCLVPTAVLSWRFQHQQLGFNPLETVARYTGDWTLRFLIATLLITPLRRIPGLNFLIKFRRMLGLFAFFYGTQHFLHYLAVDKIWDWEEIYGDFTMRRFYIFGLIGWLAMLPLAITSFNAAIRWMGGKRWQMLHRLVYVAGLAGVIHYFMQGKAANPEPLVYCAIMMLLLLSRVGLLIYKARTTRRVSASTIR